MAPPTWADIAVGIMRIAATAPIIESLPSRIQASLGCGCRCRSKRANIIGLGSVGDLPHVKLFVHLAYATAGRSSALLGLTWDRCDFERGKINLEDPAIDHPHKGRADPAQN